MNDEKFVLQAINLAIEGIEKRWGGPFGAVVVKNGKVIGFCTPVVNHVRCAMVQFIMLKLKK